MKRRYEEGNKRGRVPRPIGEMPGSKEVLRKQILSTNLFLEEHCKKIGAYEQIKDFGDAVAFAGEQGLGMIVFLTNGFEEVSKGISIPIYNVDFSRKTQVDGNIHNIIFKYPNKYYYAVPNSRDAIRGEDECWFTPPQDIIKFNIPVSMDLMDRGLYRVLNEELVKHVGEVFKDPVKEMSKHGDLPARELKLYSFGQQCTFAPKRKPKEESKKNSKK